MTEYVSLLDRLTAGRTLHRGFDSWGMKTVDGLRRTTNKFHWPPPGQSVRSWDDGEHSIGLCPVRKGDGLTVAVHHEGMSSGGLSIHSVLLVAYRSADVVSANLHKVRTSGDVFVVDEWLIREIDLCNVDLTSADMRNVNLRNANLRDADLRSADLSGADMIGTDLRGADLRDADLSGADLRSADLSGADMTGTDLRGADLRDADLSGANLQCVIFNHGDFSGAIGVGA